MQNKLIGEFPVKLFWSLKCTGMFFIAWHPIINDKNGKDKKDENIYLLFFIKDYFFYFIDKDDIQFLIKSHDFSKKVIKNYELFWINKL